jgi:hypothetical protein
MNKLVTNSRVTRWFLLLQEFNITIIDRPGKDNLVDFLSRLIHIGDNAPLDDNFPWYENVANYLVTRKLPHNLSPQEK